MPAGTAGNGLVYNYGRTQPLLIEVAVLAECEALEAFLPLLPLLLRPHETQAARNPARVDTIRTIIMTVSRTITTANRTFLHPKHTHAHTHTCVLVDSTARHRLFCGCNSFGRTGPSASGPSVQWPGLSIPSTRCIIY